MQKEEFKSKMFGQRYKNASLSKSTLSVELCGGIAKWIKNPNRFLVLTGPPGTGKTYICAALVDYFLGKINFIRYFLESDLFMRLRSSMQDQNKGDYAYVLQHMLDDDLVIFDDVGSTGYTDWREEVLSTAINLRYNMQKPTVYVSNLSKDEFKNIYGERISSRLFAAENTILDFFREENKREHGL